jgi:glycosyltransferase involved in cell wall biosynthesis
MNLAIFPALGDSLSKMSKTGQDVQLINEYLPSFLKKYSKIYFFSYDHETPKTLPKNVTVLSNKYKLHRYLYGILMPFVYRNELQSCNVIRAYHLSGTFPAIISKVFLNKPFIFNYGYDYKKFALIEKKYLQHAMLFVLQPFAILLAKKIFMAGYENLKISKKSIYLPNGVNLKIFTPKKNKNLQKCVRLLSVGRLESQKNYPMLLESVSGLNVDVTIVGTGQLKFQLLQKAKKMGIILKIIDKVPHNQMPSMYKKADIFVMSSLTEGNPKALLEALATGLPSVGTKVEGIKEIIIDKENGLLSDTTTKDIRAKIMELIKSKKLREKLSKNARKTIVEKYDLQKLLKIETSTLITVK